MGHGNFKTSHKSRNANYIHSHSGCFRLSWQTIEYNCQTDNFALVLTLLKEVSLKENNFLSIVVKTVNIKKNLKCMLYLKYVIF